MPEPALAGEASPERFVLEFCWFMTSLPPTTVAMARSSPTSGVVGVEVSVGESNGAGGCLRLLPFGDVEYPVPEDAWIMSSWYK